MAAFGTGDHDPAFALRYAADCAAAGTGEIFMLLVHALLLGLTEASGNGIPEFIHKPGVFRSALLQIAGKHTEDRPDQKNGGNDPENNKRGFVLQEHGDHIQQDRRKK